MATRVYATPQQLATFLPGGDTVPAETAPRALRVASQIVDGLLVGRTYATDPATLLPTDPDVAQSLADATCAIAVSAYSAGLFDAGSTQQYGSVSIGSVSLSNPIGTTGALEVDGISIPAEAVLALRSVGPMSVSVTTR